MIFDKSNSSATKGKKSQKAAKPKKSKKPKKPESEGDVQSSSPDLVALVPKS